MKINAYILAADPAWIEASVLTYYEMVEKIVVSYDKNSLGWTGKPVSVTECLARLKKIDVANKLDFRPGHYARQEFAPMANETFQRREALAVASEDADWVLQFDTDELLTYPQQFREALEAADQKGFHALDYPSRWLFQYLGQNRYLEQSSSRWQVIAAYPGPLAIRANSRLQNARQTEDPPFRVDFAAKSTDPWRPSDAPVHQIIDRDLAVMHLSMVRTPAQIKQKIESWGHANDKDWDPEIQFWNFSKRHPLLAVAGTPFRRQSGNRRLRLSYVDLPQIRSAFHEANSPHRL